MSYYDPNEHMVIRPMEEWFVENPKGDVVFADPFVAGDELPGVNPLTPLDPKRPPAIFRNHPLYQDGFDYFRHIRDINPDLQIGILLTGAEVVADLGDPALFEGMMAQSDVIAVGYSRGIAAEAAGRLSLPKDVEYQREYKAYINEVAGDYSKTLIQLDLASSFEDSESSPTDELLLNMRQAVVDRMRNNDLDPSQYDGAELAYRNIERSRIVGTLGILLSEAQHMGGLRDFAGVILPAEHLGVVPLLVDLGMPAESVGASFAKPDLATNDAASDAHIFETGVLMRAGE